MACKILKSSSSLSDRNRVGVGANCLLELLPYVTSLSKKFNMLMVCGFHAISDSSEFLRSFAITFFKRRVILPLMSNHRVIKILGLIPVLNSALVSVDNFCNLLPLRGDPSLLVGDSLSFSLSLSLSVDLPVLQQLVLIVAD